MNAWRIHLFQRVAVVLRLSVTHPNTIISLLDLLLFRGMRRQRIGKLLLRINLASSFVENEKKIPAIFVISEVRVESPEIGIDQVRITTDKSYLAARWRKQIDSERESDACIALRILCDEVKAERSRCVLWHRMRIIRYIILLRYE